MSWQQFASTLLITVLFVSTQVKLSESFAVMSVDLGSNFMKIGIVKPGVPMEIVLNLESKRTTATIIAFKGEERQFSDLALSTRVKMPVNAYIYLMDIVGKQFNDPAVKLYQERFPFYTLVKDEERGTVIFKVDEETSYSTEELLGMLLEYCKQLAENFAEQNIKDVVVTVPTHFNQAERNSVKEAVHIGGLNLLQLMSVNAAVALNYGVFRRKDFSNKPQYIIFYDMGASSTTASVVGYVLSQSKEDTRDINPQLTIHGVAFDNRLGGLEMTMRFRNYLAEQFNKKKLTTQDVFKNQRSMAKLFKEAERVKMILSANSDHYAQVENLIDNQDMRIKVTRSIFEELNADLFERVAIPIKKALEYSEITLEEIKDVILMGGGTRIPKVQENLLKVVKRKELGKSINTDEAAALGAVYQAAHLSQGFRVKKFTVKEATVYPIVVEFKRQKTGNAKTVKRTLFGRGNTYPVKKVMTFNKHTDDFTFSVGYGDLNFITDDHRKSFHTMFLKNISLTGVGDAYAKHTTAVDYKGVRVHFRMDESGLLHLDGAESIFEQAPDAVNANEESTWSKLGNTLSGFFRGNEETDGMSVNEEGAAEKTASADKETGTTEKGSEDGGDGQSKEKKSEKPQKEDTTAEKKSEKVEKPTEQEQKESDKTPKDDDTKPSDKNQTNTTQGTTKKDETPKVKKPGILKENLKMEIKILDLSPIAEKKLKESKNRLAELKKKDEEKRALEHSKNELESYIFDMQDKLSQEDYIQCSTEEQREAIRKECSDSSDWLYEQDDSTKTEEYVKRLNILKAASKDLLFRVKEMRDRPVMLDTLKSLLNHTEYFYKNLYNHTFGDDPVFTQVEVNTLGKLINETYAWRKNILAEQAKTPLHEKPKLLTEDIALKIRDLDREVNYLVYKAKSYRPKPKVKPDATNTTNSTEKADSEKVKTDSDTEKTTTDSQDTADSQTDKKSEKKPPHRNDGEL
ncbi:hypoxia up-regulated protein 1 [Octopus sinensis]|uniref:Hypoxia up-regulated protein 1 n=1 Tax=Octopus sinensis TaxID=2607531 RepID=A0A6P7TA68_9MOLL|nr:hypoxia up-regulated protein 1 [Octopus sinensis]